MHPKPSLCLFACLALACCLAAVEAKPAGPKWGSRSQLRNSDHQLLAVASDHQQVEYVERAFPEANPNQQEPQHHNVQYVYQVEPEAQPRSVQYVPLEQHQPEPAANYPGEVIYSSRNGENTPEDAYAIVEEPQLVSGQQQVDPSARLPDSSLAATILTEVPLRDLPYEVLENLKREYGVKVVATRERPGADLLINCDDQSNSDVTICNRQSSQDTSPARGPTQSLAHFHTTPAPLEQAQPQEYARYPMGAGEASPEAYNGEAATREAEESYGYRSSPATTEASTEVAEQAHTNNAEPSAIQEDAAQGEQAAPQDEKASEGEKAARRKA